MRIITKLTLGFLSVALLVLFVGFYSANRSRKMLEKTFGENAVFLAQDVLNDIDKAIYKRIEEIRSYSTDLILAGTIKNSNLEFEAMDDVEGYISGKEKDWLSDSGDAFVEGLMGNMLSRGLSEKVGFYERGYHYKLFGEIFATNRYGTVVGLTSKTTDYYQADEEWWQRAKENSLYVSDIEFDTSSGIYSNDICVRIDDEDGSFLGILKAVLNNREAIEVIRAVKPEKRKRGKTYSLIRYETMHFDLLTKNGGLIYSSVDYAVGAKVVDDPMASFPCDLERGICADYFVHKNVKYGGREEIVAYAYSRGYRDFKGLGWILLAQGATDEIYAPVKALRKALLTISLFAAVLAIFLGLVVSNSIYRPIEKLRVTMSAIGKGDLDAPIEINTKDEIRDLADSMKAMVSSIKDKQFQLEEAKNTMEEWSANLEKKVAERTKELKQTQDATFNIMEDLQEAYSTLQETQGHLIQAEKMEAIGRMASGVAHEVKNPLSIILQGINYFERVVSRTESEKSDILRMMKEELNRASGIISALMDFSRVTKLEIRAEDVNPILENSLILVHHQLVKDKIGIMQDLGRDLPRVLVDKPKIEQVFINIFLNSIQAMSEGGTLTIRSSEAKLDKIGFRVGRRKADSDFFGLGETAVIVEIEDTGSGIPKGKLRNVFDPFFTTKEVGKGTGLGLSVSKNIIDMHRGAISIESEEGKGTKITLMLKIAQNT